MEFLDCQQMRYVTIAIFQSLLRLGFWVPFLLSFMVFFAWGTFLSCQSYW